MTMFQFQGAGDAGGADLLRLSNIPIGPVARAAIGTDAVHVAGSLYVAEIAVQDERTVTNIAVLNGTVVGTDNLIVALYDRAGNLLRTSALAGVLSAGADDFQVIALTAPINIQPGRYFVAVQCNGTTAATQRIPAATYLNSASIIVGVFGTVPATITVPTTTTANAGPIVFLS
ncbi:MAG: hypothetical protein HC882_00370 [Acidobacteria bacterium]|nr:hypothetical protein [Acidobacteriota bacterium]